MKVSVVIPAYNEAQRILPSLRRILEHLEQKFPDYEILVVDDGSTDDTRGLVERAFPQQSRLRVLTYGANRGKGYAVRHGALHATGDLVLFTDADLSTPIEEMDKMVTLAESGYDLVISSRAHREAEIRAHQNLLREISGKLFNVFVRLVVGVPFKDTQCGFKLFRRQSMRPVLELLTIDRFAFDVELIALALALGKRAMDVPVVWTNSPASTVSLWGGAQAYTELWGIRRRAKRLRAEQAALSKAAA